MKQPPLLKIYHASLSCIPELVLIRYDLLARIIDLISATALQDCFVPILIFTRGN